MNKNTFVVLGLILLLFSCRSYEDAPVLQDKFREVHLGVMPEKGVSVDSVGTVSFQDSEPGQSGLLYAVQIHSREKQGSQLYKPYCLGLYDDVSKMTFKLNTAYLYKIEVTAVAAGKSSIAINAISGLYMQPFTISGLSGSSQLKINEVMYSTKSYFNSLALGASHLAAHNNVLFQRPSTNRYYGLISDVNVDNTEPVVMTLQRVVFGMRFCPVGFDKGELMVQVAGAPSLTLLPGHDSNVEYIYTFTNSQTDPMKWILDSYSEVISVKVLYRLPDAQFETLYSKNLTITRRGLYVVNVNLGNDDDGGSELVSISCESNEWTSSTPIDI